MVQIKTVETTASEMEIAFDKFNLRGAKDMIYVWVRNLGDGDIYMADKAGVTAEADDVILLSAGSIGLVTTVLDHKIFVKGESKIEAHAQFFAECPFRGVGSGGSTGVHILGTTTTPLSDGATTNPITVYGQSVTAKNGDIAIYSHQEFIFDGTHWSEFGDMSGLGDLAYKDSATGSFTPQGTISAPTFTGTTASLSVSGTPTGSVSITPTNVSVPNVTSVGTLPVYSYDAGTENLIITPGTLPTLGTDISAMASATASFTGSSMTSTGNYTPEGSISTPTFAGAAGTVTVS